MGTGEAAPTASAPDSASASAPQPPASSKQTGPGGSTREEPPPAVPARADPVAESLRLYEARARRQEEGRRAEQQAEEEEERKKKQQQKEEEAQSRGAASGAGASAEGVEASGKMAGPAASASDADVAACSLVPWWPRLREVARLIAGRAGEDYAKAAKAVKAALLRARVAGPAAPVLVLGAGGGGAHDEALSGPRLMQAASQRVTAAAIRGLVLPGPAQQPAPAPGASLAGEGSAGASMGAGAEERKEDTGEAAAEGRAAGQEQEQGGAGVGAAGTVAGWSKEALARAREQAIREMREEEEQGRGGGALVPSGGGGEVAVSMTLAAGEGKQDAEEAAGSGVPLLPGSTLPVSSGAVKPVSRLLQGDF